MELRYLKTFRTVIRAGSFFRAAEELDCAQSTVTLHVQKLEAALGVQLFDRDGKRPRLTEAGETLRDYAARVLDQAAALERAMTDLGTGERGQVRIGAIEPTAGQRLPAIIVPFCQRRPGVRLTLEAGGTRALSERVAAGELDLAICSAPAASLGLSFEPLFSETMLVLMPADHPLATRGALLATDLRGEPTLAAEPGCAYRESVERALLQRGVSIECRIEIGSVEAVKGAVQHGLGLAIIAKAAVAPAPPGVVVRQLHDVDLEIPIGITRRPNGPPPNAALQSLTAMLRARLSDVPHPAPDERGEGPRRTAVLVEGAGEIARTSR